MKPIRMTCLKFSVLLVAVVALILTSALSAQAVPSGQLLLDAAKAGDAVKMKPHLTQGAAGKYRYENDESVFIRATEKEHVKVLVTEATYLMGDGETPVSAEARVIQEAKRQAIEEAGTYVQVYTQVKNFKLTADDIINVAGGVIQITVLEANRKLIGQGLQFYVKIEARVRTGIVEELVNRIKGKNIVRKYVGMQQNDQRLNNDVDNRKADIVLVKTLADPPDSEERNCF